MSTNTKQLATLNLNSHIYVVLDDAGQRILRAYREKEVADFIKQVPHLAHKAKLVEDEVMADGSVRLQLLEFLVIFGGGNVEHFNMNVKVEIEHLEMPDAFGSLLNGTDVYFVMKGQDLLGEVYANNEKQALRKAIATYGIDVDVIWARYVGLLARALG